MGIQIRNQEIYAEAGKILHQIYGPEASFREGQYEAIEATLLNRRTLVVQKTGWGKSLVYFACTKLNRMQGRGMTLVISPLLVLMQNQMEMAGRMGLKCAALNSQVKAPEDRQAIFLAAAAGSLDLLFITPETLMKDETQGELSKWRIGLFVVDEAHCISDWGHDFRLEYGKLGRVISGIFSSVPVLATTATASDRVVADLRKQLGNDVYVSRGPLTRPSLHIQVLHLQKKAERYAWLLSNLKKLPGTGIIYCLDRMDCEYLADFLETNGIPAKAYYARTNPDEEYRNDEAMDGFVHNRLKAIVATIKLGMGYDKGDISFVIHFQSPSNIVAWYQQIGRAGRQLKDAYVFLMAGSADDVINEYFIETAFPKEEESRQIMEMVATHDGITKKDILASVNIRPARAEKALYFMEQEGFVRKEYVKRALRYFPTPKPYVFNGAHYAEIQAIRRREMEEMHELVETDQCLSRFAVNCLDDPTQENCGRCANCLGRDVFPGLTVCEADAQKAADYISSKSLTIYPRQKWPDNRFIPPLLRMERGLCLSRLGDVGYGTLVLQGLTNPDGFDPILVGRSAEFLKDLLWSLEPTAITFVPSLRSSRVRDFAQRLASRLGLPLCETLGKRDAPPQKQMENSDFQCRNAMESFYALDVQMPDRVLLVDDLVDSRWTLTVCAARLAEKGCQAVAPFVLADSSRMEA